MFNRLKWIAVSYVTSPTLRGIVGLAVVFELIIGAASLNTPPQTSLHSFLSYGSAPIRSRQMLEEVRRSGSQAEVDEIDLGALWAGMAPTNKVWDDSRGQEVTQRELPDADFFHILREFPNLKIVRITFYGNDRGIDELAKLQHLSELEINGLRNPTVGPQNLAWIGRLTNLRALKVGCPGDRIDGLRRPGRFAASGVDCLRLGLSRHGP